jgi:serine/threonine-protein kinase
VVADFGIALAVQEAGGNRLTQTGLSLGTPQYMAPEQATGRNDEIDARTDVFAFGAMTFEMLAGKPPFTGDTLAAVIHAIVYAPTPPLATLAKETPPAIVAAIERAMEKNRDARFPDVNSFVKAVTSRSLATTPGTEQVSARPVTVAATERISREPSRTPVYITFAIGVVVALAFTIWKVMPREPEEAPLPQQPASPSTTVAKTEPPPPPPPPPKADKPTPPANTIAEPPPAEKSTEPKTGPTRKAEGVKTKETALPPEAARDLDEAEAALEGGKPADAVRLAQHSLYAQKSSRAYAVIARARCAQGDLGNAKAALAQVAARDRSAVVRACGKLGIELR